jgi:hypothetical protein
MKQLQRKLIFRFRLVPKCNARIYISALHICLHGVLIGLGIILSLYLIKLILSQYISITNLLVKADPCI